MNKIKLFFINLRASLWFVPGLMIAFSIALALVLIEVGSRVKTECEKEKGAIEISRSKKDFRALKRHFFSHFGILKRNLNTADKPS